MSNKYLRVCNLIVGKGKDLLDLSGFKIRFIIQAAQQESPNTAEITIYNLSDSTNYDIRKKFDSVLLQVGYEGSDPGVIFSGTIKQFKFGKEDNVTKFMTIYAADGDYEYTSSVVKGVIPAGTTPVDQLRAATALSNPPVGFDTRPNLTGLVPNSNLVRDKVLFGMSRQISRQLAKMHGLSWTYNSGQITFIPLDGYLPGQAVEINSDTGMIGIPEQTDSGFYVRCLIDPKIQVGGLIRLNPEDIQSNQLNSIVAYNSRGSNLVYNAAADASGLFMVYSIDYRGDTRGQDWYSDLICLAVNPNTLKVELNR